MLAEPLARIEYQSAAYDAFEHLCASLSLSGDDLVAMVSTSDYYTAYLDESYNQRTAKNPTDELLYTVSCLLATVDQWNKLRIRWNSALKHAGIEWFHMTDYENRQGVYAKWSDHKRVTVLKRLHAILSDHMLYGCAMVVHQAEFTELVNTDPWAKEFFFKTPYGFDAKHCIISTNEWCNRNNVDGKIHYLFAHLAKQGGVLDRMFGLLLSDPQGRREYRLNGTWTKGFPWDVVQLQAADIIAYEINKRSVNEFSEGKKFTRKSLSNLNLDYEKFEPIYWGKEELQKLLDERRGL